MFRLASAAATVVAATALPIWYGLVPADGNAVSVVTLSDNAVVNATLGTVSLGNGERTWPDGFRCIRGFCVFASTAYPPGNPIPTGSYIYNVTAMDGTVHSKTPCPGFCRDVHVDYTTGRVFTLSLTEGSTIVTEIVRGATVNILDVTALLGNADVFPGGTTHCSEVGPGGHFYIGANNEGDTPDVIFGIDIASATADSNITLPVPLFSTLWAKCDGSGTMGGVSFLQGHGASNGTATFGTLSANGAYTAGDSISVSPAFVPSGLLTGMSDNTRYLAAFFPQYTPTNATGVEGLLWAVEPFGGSDNALTRLSYYLIGASWDLGK